MLKLLAILVFLGASHAVAEVQYSNGRVLMKDEVVFGKTDFKIDVSVSDTERPHLMEEVFRHRLLGYLRTTAVPEEGQAVDKITLRLAEFKEISQALSKRKPAIVYTPAQPKNVNPIAGISSEPVEQPVVKTGKIFEELQALENAYSSSDYLTASTLLSKAQNTRAYAHTILPPNDLNEYLAKYNITISKTSSNGLLKSIDGTFSGTSLAESESSAVGKKARALINYAMGLEHCSGEQLVAKLIIVYVFAKPAVDPIFLKTRSVSSQCNPDLLSSLLDSEIEKIGVLNSLEGNTITEEIKTQLLNALSSEVFKPTENLKNKYINQISKIIS